MSDIVLRDFPVRLTRKEATALARFAKAAAEDFRAEQTTLFTALHALKCALRHGLSRKTQGVRP